MSSVIHPRPRGCRPAPHKLAAACPFRLLRDPAPAPPTFATVPASLSYWLNQQDGDCVTAEECFNIDVYSTITKNAAYVVSDASVQRFISQHGYTNGAALTDVMQTMETEGLADGGHYFKDGTFAAVDWTNYEELSAALWQCKGSVKIAVAANQLESAATQSNGWWLVKAKQDNNTDHCVGLSGYGTAAQLAERLAVSIPAGLDPQTLCVLLFTWKTIGIVSHPSLCAITSEAYARSPSSIQSSGPAPRPQPQPHPWPRPWPRVAA